MGLGDGTGGGGGGGGPTQIKDGVGGTNLMGVDAYHSGQVKLYDNLGNPVGSTNEGGGYSLNVHITGGGPSTTGTVNQGMQNKLEVPIFGTTTTGSPVINQTAHTAAGASAADVHGINGVMYLRLINTDTSNTVTVTLVGFDPRPNSGTIYEAYYLGYAQMWGATTGQGIGGTPASRALTESVVASSVQVSPNSFTILQVVDLPTLIDLTTTWSPASPSGTTGLIAYVRGVAI